MTSGQEIDEFGDDGALDERDATICSLVERTNAIADHPGFCGVDVSGVRANIAMLATLIQQHGGGHLIKRLQVEAWARRIDQPFTDASLWGFVPWPEDAKSEWRTGCQRTVQRLLDVLEDL